MKQSLQIWLEAARPKTDASSIPDYGVVCKGQWNGEEVVGVSLTWNKRYITLAPVATVLRSEEHTSELQSR